MQFIVFGYDGSDEGASARRMAAREEHLKQLRKRIEQGIFLYASAILDDDGKMIGSMIVCDFPSRGALEDEWLKREPYVMGDVWQRIEVRRAQVPAFLMR
jgi:uncharacterized protein YciI